MSQLIPIEISEQISIACSVVDRHLGDTILAIHLFGSAVDGGLKRQSDIDLLVTVTTQPEESVRRALMLDLLTVSAPVDDGGSRRPLEVTVITYGHIVPWRYPPTRELQFGEWLRQDLLAGIFEPAVRDHDLAILLTKVRLHSVPLVGASAETLFDPVPPRDFSAALADTIAQWNTEADWKGDERNVVLALARVWYSAVTGRIAPKDVAAAWVLERLAATHRPVLAAAREAYVGIEQNGPALDSDRIAAFVRFAKSNVETILEGSHPSQV